MYNSKLSSQQSKYNISLKANSSLLHVDTEKPVNKKVHTHLEAGKQIKLIFN